MKTPTPPCRLENETRRGFLGKAVAAVCGAAALAIPVAAGAVAFLNPLRQKSQGGRFMRLASLDIIPEDGTPLRAPVIADRVDAWNRFPKQPIGAVFLRRVAGRSNETVLALQVICPHAGCSINYDAAAREFVCPCHEARFDLNGDRTDAVSQSPRNMDTLDVEIRGKGEVWVKFEPFDLGTAEKVAQA